MAAIPEANRVISSALGSRAVVALKLRRVF